MQGQRSLTFKRERGTENKGCRGVRIEGHGGSTGGHLEIFKQSLEGLFFVCLFLSQLMLFILMEPYMMIIKRHKELSDLSVCRPCYKTHLTLSGFVCPYPRNG